MEEIKKSCIEMDADTLIKMCNKMMEYVKVKRKICSNKLKEEAIAQFRKKTNKWWRVLFSKKFKEMNDQDLFKWMLRNCPRYNNGGGFYKMYELMQYEWNLEYGEGTTDACEEMIFLAKQSKKSNGKVFVTAEELGVIYREDINENV